MSKTVLTADEFKLELRKRIDREFAGKQRAAAKAWNVYEQHISNTLTGVRMPPSDIAAAMGYRKEVCFRPIATGTKRG
jgi:hypothetical protein